MTITDLLGSSCVSHSISIFTNFFYSGDSHLPNTILCQFPVSKLYWFRTELDLDLCLADEYVNSLESKLIERNPFYLGIFPQFPFH